ncbi:Uncharacterised protein r2_g3643 [Pycnogonum litorale]
MLSGTLGWMPGSDTRSVEEIGGPFWNLSNYARGMNVQNAEWLAAMRSSHSNLPKDLRLVYYRRCVAPHSITVIVHWRSSDWSVKPCQSSSLVTNSKFLYRIRLTAHLSSKCQNLKLKKYPQTSGESPLLTQLEVRFRTCSY